MKKLYTLLLLIITYVSFGQTTITQWDFDSSTATPTTGTGTVNLIGGITAPASPNNFPAGNPSTGKAISSENYPAQGTASGTAGFQISTSTAGYSGITISFEQRGSNTASRWSQYEYTTDGTNWTVIGNNSGAIINGWPSALVSLSLPATVDNNPNFSFRIVSIFSPVDFVENSVNMPANSAYEKINTTATSTYGVTGTWRLDNVTISGTSLSTKDHTIAGLKLYPNPVVNGTLFIETAANAEKAVAVYDVLGKNVLNASTTENAVNVSSLRAGVYMVKITEEGKTATRKLVIK